MRKIFALSMIICLTYVLGAQTSVRAASFAAGQYDQYQDYAYEPYTAEQLDNLLAPIALYPDPLLAQVLIASTFPDQIQDAANWVRRYGANDLAIDDQPWDVSVKAVAHYPTVLSMMNDRLDWTTALGQAYVNQSTDTMSSVQHLRQLARSEGNLISTPQQQVIVDGGYIEIVPAQPRYIFVPTYDPGVIYSRRVYTGSGFGGFFSFSSGLAIGAWLNYDLDWGSRRVVYDGWRSGGGGWRERSRPYVRVTNVYVNNRYESVPVNRTVVNRQVNYDNVNRFNSVHRDVKIDNRFRGAPGGQPNNGANRNERGVQPSQPPRSNEGFNTGRGQNQAPAPAPQQSPQVSGQSDNRFGGRQNQGGQNQAPPATVQPSQPSRSNEGFNTGRGQNNNNDRGRGGQNQAPPATVQPSQPPRSNEGINTGRGQNQAPAPAPQQSPQVPRQNDNSDRGRQNQAPPARVEQPAARPAPPPAAAQPQPSQPPRSDERFNRGRGQDQAPAPAPQQPQQAPRQNQAPPARVEQPAARPAPAPAPPAQAQQPQRGNQPQGRNDQNNKDNNKDNKDNKDNKH